MDSVLHFRNFSKVNIEFFLNEAARLVCEKVNKMNLLDLFTSFLDGIPYANIKIMNGKNVLVGILIAIGGFTALGIDERSTLRTPRG